MKNIKIESDFIKLDQFLKLADIASTGGEAKVMIMSEEIRVNSQIETQRGKKLFKGDIVTYMNDDYIVK